MYTEHKINYNMYEHTFVYYKQSAIDHETTDMSAIDTSITVTRNYYIITAYYYDLSNTDLESKAIRSLLDAILVKMSKEITDLAKVRSTILTSEAYYG